MHRQKILVVEDNIYVRRLFGFALAAHYDLIEAGTRDEAWGHLLQAIPDLAFVDVGLNEDRGGLMLLDAMRADARFSKIPVAIVSARSLAQDVQAAKDRGANAYLTKPFSVEQLLGLARTLLAG